MKHWPTKKLGDFCRTGSGGTPSRGKREYFDGGTVPWVKSGELKEPIVLNTSEKITLAATKETNAHIVPKNAVLVAMYGATVGETAILGIDAATNQAVCHVIPDPNTGHFRFVWYALQSRLDELLSKRVGGAQPNISQGIIRGTIVPVPPLPEQERIVKLLDVAGDLRKLRAQADGRTNDLMPALFHEMFGDPGTNSKAWKMSKFADVCVSPPNNGIFKKIAEYGTGSQVVWIEELYDGLRIDTSNCRRLRASDDDIVSYGLRRGDVLFCRSSLVRDGIGQAAYYDGEDAKVLFECHVIRFSPNLSLILPEFATAFFRHPYGKKALMRVAKTATMTTIGQKDIAAIEIPLPPLPLQQKFAQRVSEISKLEGAQTKSRQRLDDLFQSMLHRTFNGEL